MKFAKHIRMKQWTVGQRERELVHVTLDGLLQACTRFSFTYFFPSYFLNVRVISFFSRLLQLAGQTVWHCNHFLSCLSLLRQNRIEQRHQNDEFGSSCMWTWSSNISKKPPATATERNVALRSGLCPKGEYVTGIGALHKATISFAFLRKQRGAKSDKHTHLPILIYLSTK
jgi:hypothetical protein